MERVTKRIDETHACYAICERKCPDGIYDDNPACMCTASFEALKRLVQYEDTGLTPEQIRELKERDTARAPEPAPLGMDGMVCPACGKKALPWDRFCGECGQRFWEDE